MNGEVVKVVPSTAYPKPTRGSAGLTTQVHGAALTVSSLARSSGDINPGTLVQTDNK